MTAATAPAAALEEKGRQQCAFICCCCYCWEGFYIWWRLNKKLKSRASSDRWRWCFRKSFAGNHVQSNSVVSEPPTVKESQDAWQSTFYPPEDGVALDALDSLKDSSSTSSFPAIEVDQKTEGIEDLGADEIAKEIRIVKRQTNITHGLLSVMIILTTIWQLSSY
ncbi:hypothetical protein Taro_011865 [Colocasia esculenta]|uniref:Uncharacterized protein n=1 Tax=Colocasia esculenta TaxID=4460 RepID=A0A843U7I0_COLES|nr:hypothetical protein [Colocasia esculenta]